MRKLKEMETFELRGEYIQLNQLLKALGWVENGGAANAAIDEGYVMVNGEIKMSGSGKELLASPEVRAAYLEGGRH